MITRIVKLSISPEYAAEFEAVFLESYEKISAFPGCLSVKLFKDASTKHLFFTLSTWKNEEALNEYRNSELFASIWPKVKKMFNDPAEAWSTEELGK